MNEKNNNRASLPSPDVESNTGNAPVAEKDAKGFDSLVNIRVISYRKFKHDPDGVSVKPFWMALYELEYLQMIRPSKSRASLLKASKVKKKKR